MPADVRYVVTLDSDTRLPRDAIARLVGKMAHPLNRPRLDPVEGRVVEGYGVLQPRVTPSLPVGAEGSLFQRIFSSNSGIDPYSSAVSDVYQDLFGEGSYSGKGIYDIDAFEAALQGRVPDSTMLSHDLFEGVFARSGLVSDIEVVEEFPARYDVAAARQHRWARGDWQLLPWMLGLVKGTGRRKSAGFVPAIGFWKMFDNLRRTLSAPAAIVALLAGWTLPLPAALALDGLRRCWSSRCRRSCRSLAALLPRHAGITDAQPYRCPRHGYRVGAVPDRASRRLSRPSCLADGGCDRPDAVPARRQPAAAARVDHRGPVQAAACAPAGSASTARWREASPSRVLAALFVWRCRHRGDSGRRCHSSWPGSSRRRSPAG